MLCECAGGSGLGGDAKASVLSALRDSEGPLNLSETWALNMLK